MTSTDHRHQQEQADQAPAVAMKPQVKKQARRRTHASRPYQERLLNMAEARREIVTALKIHRASMRHQQQPCTSSYQHQADTLLLRQIPPLQLQQQHREQQQQGVQVVFQDRSQAVPLAHSVSPAAHAVLPYDLTPLEAPMPTTAMGGYGLVEQLARGLPAQPLGLNLSFQGFVDGAKDCEDLYVAVPAVIQSASTPAAASSHSAYSPPGPATEMASGGTRGSPALSSTAEKYSSPAAAPPVLDDAERDAQSAAGETQGVECWGEAATAADDVAAASAWWSKILLESVESAGGEVAVGCAAEDGVAAGLPAEWRRWLCDDGVGERGAVTGADDKPQDVVLETKLLADGGEYDYTCCYDDDEGGRRNDGGGIALPCMDDDDIQGWGSEWFSCSS